MAETVYIGSKIKLAMNITLPQGVTQYQIGALGLTTLKKVPVFTSTDEIPEGLFVVEEDNITKEADGTLSFTCNTADGYEPGNLRALVMIGYLDPTTNEQLVDVTVVNTGITLQQVS